MVTHLALELQSDPNLTQKKTQKSEMGFKTTQWPQFGVSHGALQFDYLLQFTGKISMELKVGKSGS